MQSLSGADKTATNVPRSASRQEDRLHYQLLQTLLPTCLQRQRNALRPYG